jgi:hypothetical protein
MSQDNIDKSITTHPGSVFQTESNKLIPVVVVLSALALAASTYAWSISTQARDAALDAQQDVLITGQKCQSLEIEMARHNVVLEPKK